MNGKWLAMVTLAVVVLAVAAGVGAYAYGKNVGQAQGADIRARFFQDRGIGVTGGAVGQGNSAQGFNPNNFAIGEVKQVGADTIELSTPTEVLQVKVGSDTQIQKMASGSVSDIQPGERITVQGVRAADGTLTAQSIQIGRGPAAGPTNGQAAGSQ